MRVIPLADHVVVKRLETEETTPGGIVLPEASRDRPRQGRVLSVGDGRVLKDGTRAAPQINEGDRVIFRDYAGTEVSVNGEDLLIVNEDDILAVIN